MRRRTLAGGGLATVIAVACVCLIPGGAMAKGGKAHSASKTSEATQNFDIRRATRLNERQRRQIGDITNKVESAVADIAGLDGTIKALTPVVTKALGDLSTGLTTVGNGLLSLKTLATSTEYGFGQVVIAQPALAPQGGSFVETPNIPDDVQQAQTTQQFVAQHTGGIVVLYGVRSTESDGTGASNPAALCKVTVTNESGQTATTAANPAIGNLPFQPVPNKSAPTSTAAANNTFPFGLKSSGADADQTVTFASGINVAAGDTYTIGLACVDTSASADDPSA